MEDKKVVMVFGVFDLLHPGHINFLEQAKKLGDKLIVSVARDKNAQKIKKYPPVFNEKERVKDLRALGVVDRVVLGGKGDPWPHIIRENPQIIVLGYDQNEYVGNLRAEILSRGLDIKIKRLKPFKPRRYKSSKIRQRIKNGKPL